MWDGEGDYGPDEHCVIEALRPLVATCSYFRVGPQAKVPGSPQGFRGCLFLGFSIMFFVIAGFVGSLGGTRGS